MVARPAHEPHIVAETAPHADRFVHSDLVPFIDELVDRLPGPLHELARQHHELDQVRLSEAPHLFDMAVYFALSLTVPSRSR